MLFLLCLINVITAYSQALNQKINEWDELVQQLSPQATQVFDDILDMINVQSLQEYQRLQSKIYRIYGQYILYGLENNNNIDYARALYYFKKSSEMGNIKAQYFHAFMNNFRLDGSYNIYKNLEQNKTNPKLMAYVQDKYQSSTLIDLYFASMQENFYASAAIGYKYYKGIGVQANCSSAALFYLPVLEEYLYQNVKYVVEQKYIAQVLYDSDYYQNHELDIFGHAEIFEHLHQITHESLLEVKQLALSYYYGLNGLERNYKKAFDLFHKAYIDVGDKESQLRVAQMIIDGQGTQSTDYELAYRLLDIDTKGYSRDFQGQVYNAKGYMHFLGLGTEKNILKAIEYFKKAAEYNNPDGQFNLASVLMLPSTLERERETKKAVQYFEKAAANNHALGQYSLAMILLDGVDLFYSCELAAKLLYLAAQRGPWADDLKRANALYQREKFVQSLIKYLESAFTGFSIASQNIGVLLQQQDVLQFDEDHFVNVDQRLLNDQLFINLNPNMTASEIKQFLYDDYYQLIDDDTLLDQFLRGNSKDLSGWVELTQLKLCAQEKVQTCLMRLGDYYYYGRYEEPDYYQSYQYYVKSLDAEQPIDAMKAHIYFNMAFMRLIGLGTEKDEKKGVKYLNESFTQFPLIPQLPTSLQVSLFHNAISIYDQIQQIGFEEYLLNLDVREEIERFEQNMIDSIVINKDLLLSVILAFLFIVVYGFKLKYQNQN